MPTLKDTAASESHEAARFLPDDGRRWMSRVHVSMPWRVIPEYLELALDLGLNLEIGLDAVDLDQQAFLQYETVSKRLEERGSRISLHGPFWDLNPGSVDPSVRQVSRRRLNQFVDVFEIFQPLKAVCHTGFDPRHHHGQVEFWVSESLRVWESLVMRAEKIGVPLLLENVWEEGPELHQRLFERLPSPFFGFCFDVGHQHSFSRSTLDQWLLPLMTHIQELHLHDNDGSHDHHLPIGQGTIDFHHLFGMLRVKGERVLVTVEPHTRQHLSETLEALFKILSHDPPAFMV